MTRTLYRRDSAFMRFVSTFVALAFTLSLAGSGFAAPPVPEPVPVQEVVTPAPDAPVPEVVTESAPTEPSVEAAPTTTEPVQPEGKATKSSKQPHEVAAPTVTSAEAPTAAAIAAAALPYASFQDVDWEAWRVSPDSQIGWAKANLGGYKEGDWIPVRLFVDNTKGSTDYALPSFNITFDYLNSNKNAIAIDSARDFTYDTAASLPSGLGGGSGLSGFALTGGNGFYNIHFDPQSEVVIPAGTYGIVRFDVHLALTPYWTSQDPNHNGAREYPGSSAQGRLNEWNEESVADKTISIPVGPQTAPNGLINGVKYNDLNGNGVRDAGEPGLAGWVFKLDYIDQFAFSMTTTSTADGSFSFTGLPAGDYKVTEQMTAAQAAAGWALTTANPVSLSIARGGTGSVIFGNWRPPVTKTWSLSIDTLPAGASVYVTYKVDGVAKTTNLTGAGPYTAQVSVARDAVISEVKWYASYGGEEILLGTSSGETMNGNKTNSFTYDASVAGMKFNDANGNGVKDTGEQGLAGWTVELKRIVGGNEVLYAQAITGAGGAYSFEDVLPGTYKVYEVQQAGYKMITVQPGSFSVSNGSHVTGLDFGNLFISSGISLTKTGPAAVHVGDTITYTFTVQNTGNYTLHDVRVTDLALGIDQYVGTLAAGATFTFTATKVAAANPDPLPNTAVAIGYDALETLVTDDDDHVIDIIKPAIDVTKVADREIVVSGTSVTYTYVVTNSGEETLTSVALVDDHFAVPGGSIGTLAPGAQVTLTATVPLTSTTTNIADVSGIDPLGLTVTDQAHETVAVYNPSISIVKSADPLVVIPGEPVTYTYLVTNTGDIALQNITVVDDKLGPVGLIANLGAGMSATVNVTTSILIDTTNIGTATGFYGTQGTEFYGSVTDNSSAYVDVVHPALTVEKSADKSAVVSGDEITYSFLVTNTGDVALYNVAVVDDKLGSIGTIPFLAVGEDATLTKSTTLAVTTTNVVTATGADAQGHEATDTDDLTVPAYNPAIEIEKTVSPDVVLNGESVTYSYKVTNTGDIDLHDVEVTDDKIGNIGTIASLAVGANTTLTKAAVVTADVTNVGTALGHYGDAESDFNGTVSDTDDAHVNVIAPAVEVVKSASPSAVVIGGTVTYTFVVSNTGDVPLVNLSVDDDKLGHIGDITSLDVGASVTLTASTTLSATTTNVVTVVGADEQGNPVSDTDDAVVPVYNPSISIAKSVDPDVVLSGETVEYQYVVQNTGDITLAPVNVTDDKLNAIGTILSLAPGEVATLTATAPILVDTTNVATATGFYGEAESEFHGSVSDTDDAFVNVVAPAIDVVKTATPDAIVAGEQVLYTYTVTNVGDVVLNNVTLNDDKLGLVGTLPSLGVGLSSTFTMTTTLSVPTTNTVTAVGVDDFGHEVSDEATAFVDVALPFTPPDLTIDKSADKTAANPGDTVKYTLTYRNLGPSAAEDITIVDDFDERYVTVTDAAGGTVADGKITWNVAGPLYPEDGPQTITYTVRIDPDLPADVSVVRNTVVISEPTEENTDNNTDTWAVDIEQPFLPFTGGQWTLIALAALAAAVLGIALRRLSHPVAS